MIDSEHGRKAAVAGMNLCPSALRTVLRHDCAAIVFEHGCGASRHQAAVEAGQEQPRSLGRPGLRAPHSPSHRPGSRRQSTPDRGRGPLVPADRGALWCRRHAIFHFKLLKGDCCWQELLMQVNPLSLVTLLVGTYRLYRMHGSKCSVRWLQV